MRDIKFTQFLLTLTVIIFAVTTIFSGNKGVKNPNIDVISMTANSISLSELINEDTLSQEELEAKISAINRDEVSVFFNENKIEYDTRPQFLHGRLMIPIRSTLEAMGFDVEWSGKDMSVKVSNNNIETKTSINDNTYFSENEKIFALSDSPIVIKGRTVVPIEFFHETLGLDFEVKEGSIVFFKEDMPPLNTYKGYLVKATEREDVITYYLSEEKDGEVNKSIKVRSSNSFYQKTPVIGNYINIVGSLEGDSYVGVVVY